MQNFLRRGRCGNHHLHPFLHLHVGGFELVKWARGGLGFGFLVQVPALEENHEAPHLTTALALLHHYIRLRKCTV